MNVFSKTISIANIIMILQAPPGLASTLTLSGVVEDTGFTASAESSQFRRINLNENSAMEVFTADLNTPIQTWIRLTGSRNLTVSSYIKVIAP